MWKNFLRDLYENPQKEEEILQMIMEKDGKFRNIHSVCVAKVCETQRQEIDDYREIIHKMTFEMIEGNPVEVYSFYEKECLMIVYFNFGAMEFPFREKLKKKKKEIEDREDLLTVGFSRTHREIYEISKAFEEAGSALQYARYLEMEEAVCIDEVEYSEPLPGELNQDQESLEFNFRMGQYEECRRQIQTYIGYLKSMDLIPELFVRKCRELLYLLQRMFNEAGTEKEQYLDIDYQELQTGKRNEGIVYSAYTFFRKLANAVSGSMSSFALAIAGFNVNLKVQSDAFAGNLWKTYTGLYVVGYLLAVLVLKFVYPLTKEKTEEMLQQLADKRNAANAE